MQKKGLISCPLEVLHMSAERAKQGAEARSCVPALSGSRGKEAGGRKDQSTFRIILEICSGKGSDVRY